MPDPRPTVYRASWVLPVAAEPVKDGAVLVGADGRIAAVGPAAAVDRPAGRDTGAGRRWGYGQEPGRRWPGAVRHGGIVPYGARSPARSAAQGHALIKQFTRAC